MPAETLELARSTGGRFIFGNADALGERDWVREQLTEEQLAFIADWPELERIDLEGLGPVLFRHGSPRSVDEIVTKLTPDEVLRETLVGVDERTVVIGHTHVQFDRTVDGKRVVNAGSVGMPYEGRTGAFWALLGPDVELRRTDYDVTAATERLRGTGYPDPHEWIPLVADPVSPDEASEFFEKQAGRG